jgi:hypothetical protein
MFLFLWNETISIVHRGIKAFFRQFLFEKHAFIQRRTEENGVSPLDKRHFLKCN